MINETKFSFETERNYFMKYANRLTDEELREVYGLFIDSDGKINELNITRGVLQEMNVLLGLKDM